MPNRSVAPYHQKLRADLYGGEYPETLSRIIVNVNNQDVDKIWRGLADNNLFVLDAGADEIGIGTATVTAKVTIADTVRTSGTNGTLLVTGAAHTTLTTLTESNQVRFNLAQTVQWATGAITTQRAFRIDAPTYAFVLASTITNAATFYVSGAPTAGTNATITNNYSIWADAGTARFDGATAIFGEGEGSTALTAATIRGSNASGTDIAGVTQVIAAGLGTGAGNAGILVLQAPVQKLAAGTTAHSLATLLQIGNVHSAAVGTTGAFLSQPAQTYTDRATAASGTAATAVLNSFAQPTIAAGNVTVTTTDAATLYIANSPTAGTNMTITRAWSQWIAGGNVRFDGSVVIGGTAADATALLAVTSTTQGILLPRMTTTQRDAITSPTSGLLIYNSTTRKLNFRALAAWEEVTSV